MTLLVSLTELHDPTGRTLCRGVLVQKRARRLTGAAIIGIVAVSFLFQLAGVCECP
jgi:hypothetical protein